MDIINIDFANHRHARNFLYLMLISGIMIASSTLQAGIPAEAVSYTLQKEKAAEFALSEQQKEKLPEVEISEQSGVYQIKVIAVKDKIPNIH